MDMALNHSRLMDQQAVEAWGASIGAELVPPCWVALHGTLGAGKSVLARAIASGLGVTADMPSPTFNLLHRYSGEAEVSVVHADLYRLSGPSDLDEIGWSDLGEDRDVVLVEWPERAGPRLGRPRIDIQIEPGPETHLRWVSWDVVGPADFAIPVPPTEGGA